MADVVIPTRNNIAQLKACLEALASQTAPPDRVHVCVDGSSDGTLEWLQAAPPEAVTLHIHPGNEHRGRAATRNLGLSAVQSSHVLLLDSDMVATPTLLERHLEVVAPGVVSVGAVGYLNRGTNPWADYLSTRSRNRYPDLATLPFRHFTTANAMLTTEDAHALRGFDEVFEGYGGEDLEFAYRLERNGVSFINTARAIAATDEPKTIDQALAAFERYGATNLHLMRRLHPEMPLGFGVERMGSRKLPDRLFLALMNPLTDAAAGVASSVALLAIRNRALNYRVVRAVHRGFRHPVV
jgi:glycosyltransferase involved in cell wall biosynthesis